MKKKSLYILSALIAVSVLSFLFGRSMGAKNVHFSEGEAVKQSQNVGGVVEKKGENKSAGAGEKEEPYSNAPAESETPKEDKKAEDSSIVETGTYTSKDDVVKYLIKFGHLPNNFYTKKEASKMGWHKTGNVRNIAENASIGGDIFYNNEGKLPKLPSGENYYEADVDYSGGKRNAKRIIFDKNMNIYYTDDHYRTFEKLR